MIKEEEILLIGHELLLFWWFMGKGSGRFVEHKLADPLVNERVNEENHRFRNWLKLTRIEGELSQEDRKNLLSKTMSGTSKKWWSHQPTIHGEWMRRRWPGVESGFLLWRCIFWRYLLRANWSTGMGFMPGHEWRGQRLNGGVKAYSATLGPCLLKMLLGHKDNDDELCWTTSKGNQRQWWWEFKWAHQLKSPHHLSGQQHQLKGTPIAKCCML